MGDDDIHTWESLQNKTDAELDLIINRKQEKLYEIQKEKMMRISNILMLQDMIVKELK